MNLRNHTKKQSGPFFIIGYDKEKDTFDVGVLHKKDIKKLGAFSEGLSDEERKVLLQVISNNSQSETNSYLHVEPGICIELEYTEIENEQITTPVFKQFLFDVKWKDCTWENLLSTINGITISHPDKPLWKDNDVTKFDYIHYLNEISPYMLPFLKNRLLTVIRYPHGMFGEKFYQKNCPDYAPDFIQTRIHENINYIVCNNDETLIWLGNQLAFEFHIPFQTIHSTGPSEIVFDLDPPSREYFPLAIKAAQILKEVFDGLKLISYIKTSGNKGLQLYIPLPENQFTYDQTRQFTEFVANFLVTKEPSLFTIERLKKNRHNKLYVDYLQHAEGKTIIAPYSVRGNDGGYVATPLFWDEVTEQLSIEDFPLESILSRIKEKGCPFSSYFEAKEKQQFQPVLDFLNSPST
ncbi:DNA ligase D [Bacillus luteolus]|uniref:DNA ligase D n=1 Tax=Litchfieldia luteola TaxID=682179 RepID=A0ABR9QLV6_9BACI|nr:DNA ligase D [Cytobacillus luteolus]MBE4909485.1 DNA ligase D [Cytobacillus luteolus]MBP1940886.1 DNA ligase D [Cytobacillus luteolus]